MFGPTKISCLTATASDFLIFSFVEVHAAIAIPCEFPYSSSNVFGMIIGGTVGVGVGVGVTVGVGVGEGVGVGVGVGFGLTTATPLFHTSFLPLFTQVYLMPLTVEIAPALLHFAPGFNVAAVVV